MAAESKSAALVGDREIRGTRVFDAPRELVWKVWTEPEHIGKWWGPNGFTTTTHKMEVKAGGVWRFVMHSPDGRDYQNKITFIEVVKPERLVYKHGGTGEKEDRGLEPVSFHVTVIFTDEGGKHASTCARCSRPPRRATTWSRITGPSRACTRPWGASKST